MDKSYEFKQLFSLVMIAMGIMAFFLAKLMFLNYPPVQLIQIIDLPFSMTLNLVLAFMFCYFVPFISMLFYATDTVFKEINNKNILIIFGELLCKGIMILISLFISFKATYDYQLFGEILNDSSLIKLLILLALTQVLFKVSLTLIRNISLTTSNERHNLGSI
jgi:hypothetical protein